MKRASLLVIAAIVVSVVAVGSALWETRGSTPRVTTVATQTYEGWRTALKRGVAEQPKRVFPNRPFPVLKQRLRDAARAYDFQIERSCGELEFAHDRDRRKRREPPWWGASPILWS